MRPRKARAAPVGRCAATNCSAALKAVDAECNVIGSGATHVLMSQFLRAMIKHSKCFMQKNCSISTGVKRIQQGDFQSFMIESLNNGNDYSGENSF